MDRTVSYRLYVWFDDESDTNILGGIDPANEGYVLEVGTGTVLQVD